MLRVLQGARYFGTSALVYGAANRTLMLNRLAYDLTEKEVQEAFSPIGGIESVSIVRGRGDRSLGHGSVVFETPELAKQASVEMQGLVLHNRPIKVQVKTDARFKGLEEVRYEILFVRQLPYDATEEDLMKYFERWQPVRSALGRAPVTDKNLGYGFVRFGSPEAAQKALEGTRGKKLGDKRIKVAFAEKKKGGYRWVV